MDIRGTYMSHFSKISSIINVNELPGLYAYTVKIGVLVRMLKYNTPKGVKLNCGLDEIFWYGVIALDTLEGISESKS